MRTLGLLPLTVGLVLAGVVACNDLTDPEPPPRPDLLGAPTALKRIKVAEPVNEPPYRRAMFGDGWGDVDRDGCNTREEIMARDLTDVTFEDDRQGEPDCNVIAGTLAEKYTGRTLRYREEDSQAVQIDHVVALSRAWRLGAWQWATTERKAFANDPLNLLAVDGPTNSRKSDQGPGTWMPPNRAYECAYARRYVRVVYKYRNAPLRISRGDQAVLARTLEDCKR